MAVHCVKYSVGNPNLDVVESLLACSNQVSVGTDFLRTLPSSPSESLNLVTDCPVETEFSLLDGFRIEGLSPSKMTRVQSVLTSMNVKVVKFRQNSSSTGINQA